MLIPPQPLHQSLMVYPMMTAHQKGPQTAWIGVADGRMFAQGAQLQEGGPGNAQQPTHLPRAIDPRPRDAGRPEQGCELALGEGPGAGGKVRGADPPQGALQPLRVLTGRTGITPARC